MRVRRVAWVKNERRKKKSEERNENFVLGVAIFKEGKRGGRDAMVTVL